MERRGGASLYGTSTGGDLKLLSRRNDIRPTASAYNAASAIGGGGGGASALRLDVGERATLRRTTGGFKRRGTGLAERAKARKADNIGKRLQTTNHEDADWRRFDRADKASSNSSRPNSRRHQCDPAR